MPFINFKSGVGLCRRHLLILKMASDYADATYFMEMFKKIDVDYFIY